MKLSAITNELRKLAALPFDQTSRVTLGGTAYTIHGGNSHRKFNLPKPETPNRMEHDIETDKRLAVSLYGGTEHSALATLRAQVDKLGEDMDPAARKRAMRLIAIFVNGHTVTREYPYKDTWEKRKRVRVYDTSAEPTLRIQPNDQRIFNAALGRKWGHTLTAEELAKLSETFIIHTV